MGWAAQSVRGGKICWATVCRLLVTPNLPMVELPLGRWCVETIRSMTDGALGGGRPERPAGGNPYGHRERDREEASGDSWLGRHHEHDGEHQGERGHFGAPGVGVALELAGSGGHARGHQLALESSA